MSAEIRDDKCLKENTSLYSVSYGETKCGHYWRLLKAKIFGFSVTLPILSQTFPEYWEIRSKTYFTDHRTANKIKLIVA